MKENDGDYYYQQYICKDNGDGTYYVSCDKEIAEEIVFMLNVYEVDTVHILEVIENLIAK